MAQDGPGRMDAASLREAALAHMLRYGGTGASLTRALDNRIHRWAEAMGAEEGADRTELATQAESWRVVARQVVESLTKLGAVNDAAFAESRARGLALSGRSRRAITARLMAKGIDPDHARAVLPEAENSELISALILARKRRIGPFRKAEPDRDKELGVLARAGFPRDVALRALAMEAEAAEEAIREARA